MRQRGASEKEVEYRGRWVREKGNRVVTRVYIDIDDPYTDAKVAALLCNGGPVKYATKEGVVVTDNWLFVECIPNVRQRFPGDNRLCQVLGLATLWAAFDPEASAFLDPEHADRIRSNFSTVHGQVEGNPVVKKKIKVEKTDAGRLWILEHVNDAPDDRAEAAMVDAGAGAGDIQELTQKVDRCIELIEGVRQEQSNLRTWLFQEFAKTNENQRRFGGTIGQALSRQDP